MTSRSTRGHPKPSLRPSAASLRALVRDGREAGLARHGVGMADVEGDISTVRNPSRRAPTTVVRSNPRTGAVVELKGALWQGRRPRVAGSGVDGRWRGELAEAERGDFPTHHSEHRGNRAALCDDFAVEAHVDGPALPR